MVTEETPTMMQSGRSVTGGGRLNIEQRAKPANPSRGIFTDV